MSEPIHNDQLNKVLLQPRFKIEVSQNVEQVLNKLRKSLEAENCKFRGKIVLHHVVLDVLEEEEHYWSPQMHIEVEKDENDKTKVKGVLGPKPKVWTFFIFLHFAVAITFFVFFVMFYAKWSLNQDYKFSMIMFIAMPIIWIILYFVGQYGKKLGYAQMVEQHDFLTKTLQNDS
jgi:ABC-type multidrug transport system fused ATPase/permease subunit